MENQILRNGKTLAEHRREISRKSARKIRGTTEASLLASNTYKARRWEIFFAGIFGAKDMNAEKLGSRYDLELYGVKIDVKVCERYIRKNKRGRPCNSSGWWVFQKNKNLADKFLCACLDKNEVKKLLLIPREDFASTGITVGNKSYFDKYAISLPSIR